jgi:hypothetical protein
VQDFLVFLDERLGKGQYGAVCKARLKKEHKKKDAKVYACKIMDVANIDKAELSAIEKEVYIHNLVLDDNCVRLY